MRHRSGPWQLKALTNHYHLAPAQTNQAPQGRTSEAPSAANGRIDFRFVPPTFQLSMLLMRIKLLRSPPRKTLRIGKCAAGRCNWRRRTNISFRSLRAG